MGGLELGALGRPLGGLAGKSGQFDLALIWWLFSASSGLIWFDLAGIWDHRCLPDPRSKGTGPIQSSKPPFSLKERKHNEHDSALLQRANQRIGVFFGTSL